MYVEPEKKTFCIVRFFKKSNSLDIIESIGLLSHKSSFFVVANKDDATLPFHFVTDVWLAFIFFIALTVQDKLYLVKWKLHDTLPTINFVGDRFA